MYFFKQNGVSVKLSGNIFKPLLFVTSIFVTYAKRCNDEVKTHFSSHAQHNWAWKFKYS